MFDDLFSLPELQDAIRPIVKTYLEDAIKKIFVDPAITWAKKKSESEAKIAFSALIGAFGKYLERSYERQRFVSTLVFPNQKKTLDDLYVPLTLVNSTSQEIFQIAGFSAPLFEKSKNVLIVDSAGMGKSTLSRFLFVAVIRQNVGIPIFIELRRLSGKLSILEYLSSSLSDLDGAIDKEILFHLLEKGNFFFFLDGFDEIADSEKSHVTAEMRDFMSKANKNKFIVTSRDQPALAGFGEFQRYSIRGLLRAEAYEVLRKYSTGTDLAERLIVRLEAPENQPVAEFLANPLLTSLLYKAFEFKQNVPLQKHIFYRQVFDALFESHDLSKDGGMYIRQKSSGLDSARFHTVTRALGFVTFHAQKVEFSADELDNVFIPEVRALCPGIIVDSAAYKADLLDTVPLLVRDGPMFRWAHKSLQEYFTAQYICFDSKESQAELLIQMYRSEKVANYLNLLTLCFDTDPKVFRHSVVRQILRDILGPVDEASADSKIPPGIEVAEFNRRQALTALKPCAYVWFSGVPIGEFRHTQLNVSLQFKQFEAVIDNSVTRKGNGSSWRAINPTIVFGKIFQESILVWIGTHEEYKFLVVRQPAQSPRYVLIDQPGYVKLLDDDPASPLNTAMNFSKVTDMLFDHAPPVPDVMRCRELLSQIEQEIELSKSRRYQF